MTVEINPSNEYIYIGAQKMLQYMTWLSIGFRWQNFNMFAQYWSTLHNEKSNSQKENINSRALTVTI